MKAIAALLGLLLIGTAAAAGAAEKPVHIRGTDKIFFAFGCLDTRDTERAIHLVEIRDVEAFSRLELGGRCYVFHAYSAEAVAAGQPPIAFEETINGDYGCVRPQGQPDCYWLRRDQYVYARAGT